MDEMMGGRNSSVSCKQHLSLGAPPAGSTILLNGTNDWQQRASMSERPYCRLQLAELRELIRANSTDQRVLESVLTELACRRSGAARRLEALAREQIDGLVRGTAASGGTSRAARETALIFPRFGGHPDWSYDAPEGWCP